MRSYRIERRPKKGLFFVCNKCEFEIELAQLGSGEWDASPKTVSVRTRAAAAMHKHIEEAHSRNDSKNDQTFGIK